MDLRIIEYQPEWPSRFEALVREISAALPAADIVSIDHIGSTSVPGLASKDVIDVQIAVRDLSVVDAWPARFGAFRRRNNFSDHPPPGAQSGAEWEKRYWSDGAAGHIHVREVGRANHRYALLFRDYLRANAAAAEAYEPAKRALAAAFDTSAPYAEAKDPVCDLVIQAAELWAWTTGWRPPPSSLE